MKITANLEFDTFAEAEKVFRHLGVLDVPLTDREKITQGAPLGSDATKKLGQSEKPKDVAAPLTNIAPTPAPSAEVVAKYAEESAAGPTLDDVKASFRDYVGKGGGRTAMTARAILSAHGIDSGRIGDARPEQFAVLKRAFDTAGPEHPLGEAA